MAMRGAVYDLRKERHVWRKREGREKGDKINRLRGLERKKERANNEGNIEKAMMNMKKMEQ